MVIGHLQQHFLLVTPLPSFWGLQEREKDIICAYVALHVLPAVPATVLLRDPVFIFTPNVHRWENQSHQHGKAAQQGKDHNALLLRLQGDEKESNIDFQAGVSALEHL